MHKRRRCDFECPIYVLGVSFLNGLQAQVAGENQMPGIMFVNVAITQEIIRNLVCCQLTINRCRFDRKFRQARFPARATSSGWHRPVTGLCADCRSPTRVNISSSTTDDAGLNKSCLHAALTLARNFGVFHCIHDNSVYVLVSTSYKLGLSPKWFGADMVRRSVTEMVCQRKGLSPKRSVAHLSIYR